jgi:hypothetical protein
MKKCIKMYENNYKNPLQSSLGDLENFLQTIADFDVEIELFALGGTAMVIKNIKEATKDIDFLTTAKYEDIKRLFLLAGLKEESPSQLCNIWRFNNQLRMDMFYGAFIMGVQLPEDWKRLSEHIRTIGKVNLYLLNWYDIIITKIARSEKRDILDIISILKSQNVDFIKLKNRYYEIAPTALIADYDIKFKHLEREFNADSKAN